MAVKPTPTSALSMKDRLSFRLAALFSVTFAAVLVGSMFYDIFVSYAESAVAENAAASQAAPVIIDPKLKTDLAQVLAFDAIPTSVEISDPFLDRTGISNTVKVTAGTVGPQLASAASPSGATSGGNAAGSAASPSGGANVQSIPGAMGESVMVSDTKSRYVDWLQRQNAGEQVGPEAETLGIEDLVPVGFTSGGSTAEEIMLYSLSLCKTFSFPVGTRFYNGWLNGLSEYEVVFAAENGIYRKSITRPDECKTAEKQTAGSFQ